MKQRLGIAAALLGEPELLVLDEPTNGLDPVGMIEMRELIARIADAGRTVLVSSHLLGELEHVADWLMIIDRGRLTFAGPASAFASRTGTEIVLGPLDPARILALADVIARHGLDAGRDGEHLIVAVGSAEPRELAASLNSTAAAAGIVLAELHVRRPTLESNYLRLLEGDVA
jgi:ABC-2 type transport system ATP-binding protein